MLVPIDFSEESLRALGNALDWAFRAPCEIHIVHVVDANSAAPAVSGELAYEFAELERIADVELRRLAPEQKVRARIGSIERHVVTGSQAAAILALAARLGSTLSSWAAMDAARRDLCPSAPSPGR